MIVEGAEALTADSKDVVVSRIFSFKWLKISYKDNSAEWVRTSAVTEKEEK